MDMVGVFGGSFNPIHNGHIAIAAELLETGSVEEIWFVVSPHNPLKPRGELWDDRLRYRLVEKALEEYPRMKACDVEFTMPQPSYMWTTLLELRRLHPDKRFMLLIGADNWLCFERWYHYEDIQKTFEIGIYPRPGYDIDEKSLPSGVRYFRTGLHDVSSTEIRQRLREGRSVEGLVPDAVVGMLRKEEVANE